VIFIFSVSLMIRKFPATLLFKLRNVRCPNSDYSASKNRCPYRCPSVPKLVSILVSKGDVA
jgi:hypothetical protein